MSARTDSGLAGTEGTDGSQNPSQTGDDSNAANSLAGAELAQAALNDPVAKDIVRRQTQSDKDRGVAEANRKAQQALDNSDRMANYLGIDDPNKIQQAKREMMLDDLITERNSGQASGTVQSQETQTPASSLDYGKAFEVAGVTPSQQDYEFALSFQGSQSELNNAVIGRKFQNPQTATGAGAVSSGSSISPATDEQKAKTDKYIEDMETILNGNDPHKKAKATKLRKEARANGIHVDGVAFDMVN